MTPHSIARAATSSVLGLTVLAAGVGPLAAPAASAAESVKAVPADGRVVLDGRGFGHGRGMSQWGAYGAADAGLSWKQILGFYYPGAAQSSQTNSEMRVWISRDNDGITQLAPQAGLTMTVGRAATVLPVGVGYTGWRAIASGTGTAVQYRDAKGAWKPFGAPSSGTPVFSAGDTVRVTMPGGAAEEYPGRVLATRSGSKVLTIVATSTERYLRGVVPNEMPASWHTQALAAQSVAARTYASAYRDRQRAKGSPWDICDTVTCQVYRGTALVRSSGRTVLDDSRANAAISATAGTVLKTPKGNYVVAEFSASNGGYTVDGGAFSQVAKPDPYDGRKASNGGAWNRTVAASTLEKQFALGTLRTMQVLSRDGKGTWGGRVSTVRLVGSSRTVDVSGAKMRQVLGLRSDWFSLRMPDVATRPANTTPPRDEPPTGGVLGPDDTSAPGPSIAANWIGDRVTDRLIINDGRLLVARGLAGGKLAKSAPVRNSPSGLVRFAGVGDVDGDKRADVIAVDSRNRLVVLRGDGRGAVAKTVLNGAGWNAFTALAVKDVTGDRRADVVATRSNGSRLLYAGTSSGRFVGKGTYTGR